MKGEKTSPENRLRRGLPSSFFPKCHITSKPYKPLIGLFLGGFGQSTLTELDFMVDTIMTSQSEGLIIASLNGATREPTV